MFTSKLRTLGKIYKSQGIFEVVKVISRHFFKPSYNFDQVAKEVTSHLSQVTNPEVYKRLSEGVYYVFGMGVEGDIAEFGTMSGRTAVALAASVNYCNYILKNSDILHGFKEQRKLWLFDSFEGLPEARTRIDKTSIHVNSGIWGGEAV
ncbi:MAG: hypothetical protein KGR70_12695 [Cyanobacteria bacterium REEB494]|nr:hypothetical protein [Cyanobacteria bacterium REEB494]